MFNRLDRCARVLTLLVLGAAACKNSSEPVTTPPGSASFSINPCSPTGTLQLAVSQATRIDCTNGGSTVTLAGNGASYLVVAELAVGGVQDAFIPYRLITGTPVSTSITSSMSASRSSLLAPKLSKAGASLLASMRPHTAQLAFDRALRARARAQFASGAWRAAVRSPASASASLSLAPPPPPALGSVRPFRILANINGTAFNTVGARLAYAGASVLVYLDTLAPANGFSSSQLTAFGQLFDQTLYPIDTTAFGPPSDIDQNGRVIMLMSPAVNALTSSSQCQTQGYIAGFFEEEDLGSTATDPNSNNAEIFYSIVPDPNGVSSCAHSAADVGNAVPATFMHELQHLISFSQHVVVHGGNPEFGWLDEGLSIVAEELGSLYYEQKCPGTQCRTNPSQIFPDSAQGFVENFLYDSYQYAFLPDTASVTLHSDSDDGFSWRGGDWLLMRYLGDQMGSGFYKRLDQNTTIGIPNIEAVSGQPFPTLFANFGLALYTDSLPSLPRATAPAADRFVTRNVRQLWNRLFVTSGGSSDVPVSYPVEVFPITSDTTTNIMYPGTMSFWRIDTPSSASTVSIQFSAPGGTSLQALLKPQLAIFRLPPGQ